MTQPLPPLSRIGILGDGQLGRMLALAAARLGVCVHIYGPDANGPARAVAAASTVAGYDDEAALSAFAASVVTISIAFLAVTSRCTCATACASRHTDKSGLLARESVPSTTRTPWSSIARSGYSACLKYA